MQTSDTASLLEILDEFGLRVTPERQLEQALLGVPTELTLSRGKSTQTYFVLAPHNSKNTRTQLDSLEAIGARLLFIADRANARTMVAYRNRGIDYIDLAGNALVRFGDVYIDVRGRSGNALGRGIDATRKSSVNLFSARRAQVIFSLMVWPELFTLPLRYTSEAAGVSMGLAYESLQLLRQTGYVIGDAEPELIRRDELINRWTGAFSTGLLPKLVLGSFRAENLEPVGFDADPSEIVSGESAVSTLIRPTTLTIYVDRLEPRTVALNRWRADDRPNVEVRKRFWKDPRQILHEDRGLPTAGLKLRVPDLLVYADLMASGNPRQREAAEALRSETRGLIGS